MEKPALAVLKISENSLSISIGFFKGSQFKSLFKKTVKTKVYDFNVENDKAYLKEKIDNLIKAAAYTINGEITKVILMLDNDYIILHPTSTMMGFNQTHSIKPSDLENLEVQAINESKLGSE